MGACLFTRVGFLGLMELHFKFEVYKSILERSSLGSLAELTEANRRKVLAFALPLGWIVATVRSGDPEICIGREVVKSGNHPGNLVVRQNTRFLEYGAQIIEKAIFQIGAQLCPMLHDTGYITMPSKCRKERSMPDRPPPPGTSHRRP